MARRGFLAREPREWVVRGVLAALAAVLGYVSVSQSLGYALRLSDPVRAYALAPRDGRVAALAARDLAGPEVDKVSRAHGAELARLALQQDGTAVAAVSVLGLNAQIDGDTARANRLLAYAGKLSRRELQTQIWAIENAVARNDIPGALRNYDIALRTSRAAPDLLFPVLAAAITEAPVRSALVQTLKGKPVWGPAFVNFASANSDPHAAVNLFQDMTRAGLAVSGESQAHVITALIARGSVNDAWRYFQAARPSVDRRTSRDPDFSANLAVPTPFDWTIVNDPEMSVAILRGDNGGIVDFSVPPGRSGPLIHQWQMLVPGEYRLTGRSSGIAQDVTARPFWILSCSDGRELGRVELPGADRADGRFAGRFTVPSGCPAQTLMLIARPSDAAGGVSGQIGQAHLIRVR
jgi:hypothetical protein